MTDDDRQNQLTLDDSAQETLNALESAANAGDGNPAVADDAKLQEPAPEPIRPPDLISRHMPAMARCWGALTEEQRTAALEDLAAGLDAAGAGGEPSGGGASPQADRSTGPSAGNRAAEILGKPPLGIDPAELDALGAEMSPQGLAALRKVIALANYASETVQKVGTAALESVETTRKHVVSMSEQRDFEQALEARSDVLEPLPEADYNLVATTAAELKKTGAVSNYPDAVDLALVRCGKYPVAKPEAGASAARTRRAIQAASLGTPARRLAPSNKVAGSYDEAVEMAREEVARAR